LCAGAVVVVAEQHAVRTLWELERLDSPRTFVDSTRMRLVIPLRNNIIRAVTDKTVRDLLGEAFKLQMLMDGDYDRSAIILVATKCDDVATSEIIAELNLENDPDFIKIKGSNKHISQLLKNRARALMVA
jgi:hypothetical protein